MMAAPPQLDAIEESPLKGCALLGSPVLDECEDNKFELFKARIDAADTAYELALEQSRFESRVEARRRASASARASAEARSEARAQHDDYFARQRLEDAIAGVKDLVGDVPDAVDDGLTPRSSLRRACEDAAAFLAAEAAEPALPSPGPRETDHSPPRTRTPARTEEEESDGSEDSGDGILAADYEGPGANRRGDVGAAPAPAAEDDDSSDWSSSAEAPAPAPLDDDDDISIVSVSSATAEDASERLSRAEGYAERYPAKAAKVLRPCITAWRGGAPIDYASNPDAGPVLAVSCCYAYARATANVAVQDGAAGENSPALVADALEALDQALELDPAHAPSTRLRGRLLPLLGEALCPRRIRASFRPE